MTFSNDSDKQYIIESVNMMTLIHDDLNNLNKMDDINLDNNYNNLFFDRSKMSLGPVLPQKSNLPKILTPGELWLFEIKQPFDFKTWEREHGLENIKRIPVGLSIVFIDFSGNQREKDVPFFSEMHISDDGKIDHIGGITRQEDLLVNSGIAVGHEIISVGADHPVGLKPPRNLLEK